VTLKGEIGMPLLEVRNLETHFISARGTIRAVDDVSFDVEDGGTLGISGESGCGKSKVAHSIVRLLPSNGKIVGGSMLFEGRNLLSLDEGEMRKIRWGKISIVPQAAMNALNPVATVGKQVTEAIRTHVEMTEAEAEEKTRKLFRQVGLDPERFHDYPFEFSGGMRQRVVIAMALCCEPKLMICDEPTAALDVAVQAQILKLLANLRETFDMSIVFISHDLSAIAELCDKIAIMYAGEIVEYGGAADLLRNPLHPYTKGLKDAAPAIGKSGLWFSIPGVPPSLVNPPSGCRFHPRCPYAKNVCKSGKVNALDVGGHNVKCHFAGEMGHISSSDLWKAYT
jgi:peptide/nickel transport system ATP-binding protein